MQEGWPLLRGAQRGLAPPRARRMPAFPAPAPGEFETPAQAEVTSAEQCYFPRFPKKQNAALRAADQIPTQRSGWDLGRRSSGMSALRLLQKIRRECAVRAFWPPAKTSAQAGFTPAEQCYFPRFPKKEGHPYGCPSFFGAGDGARTRYLHLGKVALYQMSYARRTMKIIANISGLVNPKSKLFSPHPKDFCHPSPTAAGKKRPRRSRASSHIKNYVTA